MIPVNRPVVTSADREAVDQVLAEGWVSGSAPAVRTFEEALAQRHGVEYAVAVNSGTVACGLMIDAAGVEAGDEIVVPATTIIGTVADAVRRGVRLHCVDVDPQTWCAPAAAMIAAIGPSTRALVPVHLYGLSVDCSPLAAARERGIVVLEDAAEAIGVTQWGRPCGSLGDAAAFSFYANKSVTTGEGGAVLTGDRAIAERVRSLRDLAFGAAERFVHEDLGYGARMPALSAALGCSQLARLEATITRKRQLGARYRANLAGHPWLELPVTATAWGENAYWVFAVVLTEECPYDAGELIGVLGAAGIESRRFFAPLPDQPVLRRMGAVRSEPVPNARRLWRRGLYLPSGAGTTDAEIDQVCAQLWSLQRGGGK